jgi:ubiquinone/menaquinone biosynthesis C-methylase UbiE
LRIRLPSRNIFSPLHQLNEMDFVSVTEVAGDDVTVEQVERLARRYHWAGEYCRGRDVLEVACGTGQGVGYIGGMARSMVAGDYSGALLKIARGHYGARYEFCRFDAQEVPFKDSAFDVLILFEALYYIAEPDRFFRECRRVLRPGGALLISTANKDLFDFNPSPFSHRYLGVTELADELSGQGFLVTCLGDTPVAEVSLLQRLLRPVKAVASRLGLVPKSMRTKKLLKRLIFGGLVPMPFEIEAGSAPRFVPAVVGSESPDLVHKVILCVATLPD